MHLLDSKLVDTLFARLVMAWGTHFTAMYEGQPRAAVKRDWAERLAGFQRRLADGTVEAPAIAWAIDNLPSKPMNAIAFRDLCRQYSPPPAAALPPPPARPVPARFRTAIAQLTVPLDDDRPEKVRWAYRYIAKFGHIPKLIQRRQAHLDDARAIVRRWEAEQERLAGESAAAAQGEPA